MYGIIDETGFSLRYPRMIDEGPFETLAEAFEAAHEYVTEYGTNEIAIRPCVYSKAHTYYVEDPRNTYSIQIDATSWEDEEDEEEEAAA
jgi:hypothetical protein